MFVCFYLADGNHYLIETSDNSEEAGSVLGVDYAEPGCIDLTTDFAISCVNEGSVHNILISLFDTIQFLMQLGWLTNQTVLRGTLIG